MNDKKIYQWLQAWYSELQTRKIPKAKNRSSFEQFSLWLLSEKKAQHERSFIMSVDPLNFTEADLAKSAVLQDLQVNIAQMHQDIAKQLQPIYAHYEKSKQLLGKYYNVQEQLAEIILNALCQELSQYNYELLLICSEQYYWLAVHQDTEKIHKFCKKFEKQFKDEELKIEIYSLPDCLQSI